MRRSAEHHRANIKRAAGAVRRNIFDIVANDGADRLDKNFLIDLRHLEVAGGRVEPLGILVRTKNADPAVGAGESLAAFEQRLTVMETVCSHVQGYLITGGQLGFAPFAVLIVKTNIGLHRHETEAQLVPIDVHHCSSFQNGYNFL
ncbi:hypothetical protein SDC9_193313 [bioreactor metagenome]|uniref:Uncharacterized protein n=1 Tax=bioreactor metagenome TaxID=1076179 RepID=A0A645I4R0_9ZZZZ